jgi:hypothetical protein
MVNIPERNCNVTLTYHEKEKKWTVASNGAVNEKEALQLFIAAMITCQGLNVAVLPKSKVTEISLKTFSIIPAVLENSEACSKARIVTREGDDN